MKKFIITEELGNAILSYLQDKPYNDVFGLVKGLQTLVPLEGEKGEDITLADEKAEETEKPTKPVTK